MTLDHLGWILFLITLSVLTWLWMKFISLSAATTAAEKARMSIDSAQANMEKTFKALASETLNYQSESFLKLATERLDKKTVEAGGILEQKTAMFHKLVEPIEKTLSQVQREMSEFEKKRGEQFGKISEQLLTVARSSEGLQKEAQSLSTALRRPEVRGSWGELQLRRVVELAGMSAHCDFEEQVTVRSEQRLQRPDLIIKLPNQRILAVDSKAVLNAYLDSIEADDLEKKKSLLEKHAANIRTHVKQLSLKSYWDQFESTPDFVILFIPNEAFLEAAVQIDRSLMENAWQDKIIIATPTTLIALLKAVAYGWQQNEIAKNAQKVIDGAKDLYERLVPWLTHLQKVGDKLNDSVQSYNSAIGSLDTRVLPAARKLKSLGVSMGEVDAPEPLEKIARSIKIPDLEMTETPEVEAPGQ